MAERLKSSGENSADQGSDWDILSEMAGDYLVEDGVSGSSREFKKEAAEHRESAEEFFKQASLSQREKLGQAGMRDAQDAGEYLHQIDVEKKQVERMVEGFDEDFEIMSRDLAKIGREEELFKPDTFDASGREFIQEEYFIDSERNNGYKVSKILGEVFRDELGDEYDGWIEREKDIVHNKELSGKEKELWDGAVREYVDRMNHDKEKKQQLKNSLTYTTFKNSVTKGRHNRSAERMREQIKRGYKKMRDRKGGSDELNI